MDGKLQNRRIWLAGGALVALVLIAASYFLLISPSLDDASAVRDQTAGVEEQNTQAERVNAKLARQYPRLPAMQAKLASLIEAVPPAAALPEFTRETNARAKSMDVDVQNLSLTAPTPYVASTPAATAAPSGDQSGASTGTAAVAAPVAAPSQYQIGVALTVRGSGRNLVKYVSAMQHGTRNVLVNNTVLAGSADSKAFTMTIQAMVFTAPMTHEQLKQTAALLKSVK